jgi:enterobactin synthetase component D / holo-[acyl-carrier protein] synthase
MRPGCTLADVEGVNLVSDVADAAMCGDIAGVRSPGVLPDFVMQFSCRLPGGESDGGFAPWQQVEIPAELCEAAPKRQLHFRAGRYCALRALAMLGGPIPTHLPRTAGGAPLWPVGVTGSITHTDDFVSAAVARTSQVAALGIDTERIMSPDRAARVSSAIAWPSELAHVRAIGCDRLEALTLVFSAKEAIFKCLYGSTGRIFDYRDVRVVAVDSCRRSFAARIVRTLSEAFPAGDLIRGCFEIDRELVHTATIQLADGR